MACCHAGIMSTSSHIRTAAEQHGKVTGDSQTSQSWRRWCNSTFPPSIQHNTHCQSGPFGAVRAARMGAAMPSIWLEQAGGAHGDRAAGPGAKHEIFDAFCLAGRPETRAQTHSHGAGHANMRVRAQHLQHGAFAKNLNVAFLIAEL